MQFIQWLIIAILAAALVPGIMTTLLGVDTTGWPAIAITVWDNLPIFVIIGVMFLVLKKTGILGKKGL